MENLIISKELWIDVIKPKIKDEVYKDGIIEIFEIVGNTLIVCIFYESKNINCKGTGLHSPYNINIYELAHKCKEWAFNNGFGLISGLLNYSKTKIAVLENIDLIMPKISFTDNTEVKAIFNACEWILEHKESK